MARPAEKARAMMNKWVAMRDGENSSVRPKPQRRPHLAAECEHLADADRYRGQIVREITDKIAKIQNPALSEHDVRELNDAINKLQREKFHWNKRIYQLGGLDYNSIERKRRIEEGDTQLHSIYRYYGVAKDLPGVKEHLEKEAKARTRVKRADIHKNITPDYYGWRDEDDGVLLELEQAATAKIMMAQYLGHKKPRAQQVVGDDDQDDADLDFLAVTTQDEIAKILLEEKKKALLRKYAL
jgi:pre-mRNA-splicing factor ISY1